MKKKIKVKVKVKKDCFNCGNSVKYYDAYYGVNCLFCGLELFPGCTAKALTVDLSKTDNYFFCGGSKWIEVS